MNFIKSRFKVSSKSSCDMSIIIKASSRSYDMNTILEASSKSAITFNPSIQIPVCPRCGGQLKLRTGSYGQFLGCINYSTSFCKGSMSVPEYILEFIKLNGLNVYGWDKTCWHCGELTKVYTYHPFYDLFALDDEIAESSMCVALGEFPKLDKYMLQVFPSKIQIMYSHTTHTSYAANICQHCGKIQGNNYLLRDPHGTSTDVWDALLDLEERLLDKYLIRNMSYSHLNLTISDITEYLWTEDK